MSKSFVNLCAALTLSRFCAETVLRDCHESDTSCARVRRISTRIIDRVTEARKLWPDCTDDKTLGEVSRRVYTLGSSVLHGNRTMEELISITMAILEDMSANLARGRREAIEGLSDLMAQLLAGFDRAGADHDAYAYAGEKVQEWYRVVGMEV